MTHSSLPAPRVEDARADPLFDGPGEMRALCRSHDWSTSPLGPPGSWPTSLRTIAATLLASRHPMFLFWGPRLVQLYNDAYRVSLASGGRHPRALGMCGAEFWTDIWHIIGPQIAQVMSGGESTWHEDHLVPIERNGRLEEVYWTYSYGPAFDDDGRVAGVLVVCQETTSRVQTERALRASEARQAFLLALNDQVRALGDADAIQYAAARALGEHLGAARVGYADIMPDGLHSVVTRNYTRGVRSIEGRYRVDEFNATLLPALRAGRTVVRGDVAADGSLTDAERAAHAGMQVGAAVDVPVVKDGRLVGVLFMHHDAPRDWTPDELALLESVADRTWSAAVRARAEARQRRAVEDLETVLRVAPVGIGIARDAECRDVRINPAYARLLGVSPEDDPSTSETSEPPFRVMKDGREVPPDQLPMQRAARDRESLSELEFDIVHADGETVRLLEYAVPLLDDAGASRGAVGIFVDITERSRLVEAERAARAESEAANRAKGQFLATMSHELRTPLNAIQGYTELIELGIHGPVTDAQREALSRIQTSQRHLLGLINEVLNYTRLESGTVRYDVTDVSIAGIIAAVETLVLPQARAKALALATQGCDPSVVARADREKVQQILVNLLSNAVKNTNPGGRIEVSCRHESDRALVLVADTGVGIPAHQHEAIFAPFVQVGRTLSAPGDGVGLGLAISRDLARAMGGDIVVASEEGAGSTFTLSLPALTTR